MTHRTDRRGGLVALVGVGPGDEGLLTVRAAALLARADLVVAASWVSERIAHLLRPEATVADSGGAGLRPEAADQGGQVRPARAAAVQRRSRSCSARPPPDAAACAKAKVPFEIVPGLSAATAVPAYAGIPLTQDVTGDVRIIHAAEVSRMSAGPGTLVILGAETGLADIAKMLIAGGLAGQHARSRSPGTARRPISTPWSARSARSRRTSRRPG